MIWTGFVVLYKTEALCTTAGNNHKGSNQDCDPHEEEAFWLLFAFQSAKAFLESCASKKKVADYFLITDKPNRIV